MAPWHRSNCTSEACHNRHRLQPGVGQRRRGATGSLSEANDARATCVRDPHLRAPTHTWWIGRETYKPAHSLPPANTVYPDLLHAIELRKVRSFSESDDVGTVQLRPAVCRHARQRPRSSLTASEQSRHGEACRKGEQEAENNYDVGAAHGRGRYGFARENGIEHTSAAAQRYSSGACGRWRSTLEQCPAARRLQRHVRR